MEIQAMVFIMFVCVFYMLVMYNLRVVHTLFIIMFVCVFYVLVMYNLRDIRTVFVLFTYSVLIISCFQF